MSKEIGFYHLTGKYTSNFSGPRFGTEYSLDGACQVCGTGATRVGPLIVSGYKIPKKKN